MLVHTTRFGDIEVDERQIFNFANGLPGFPYERRFAFLPHGDGDDKPHFAYLQSLETPELTFLLTDPFNFFPDYEFNIDDATEEQIGVSADNVPMVWCIAMIPDKVENMTANLVAPILFNIQNKTSAQIILDNNKYTTRHRLFPADIKEQMAKQQGGEAGGNAGTQP